MRLVQGNLMEFLPPMSLTCKTLEQYEGCELGIGYPGGLVTFYQLYTFSIAWVLATWYNLIMCFGSCMNRWNQDTQRCPQLEALSSSLCSTPHSSPSRPGNHWLLCVFTTFSVCGVFSVHLFYTVSLTLFVHRQTIDSNSLLSSLWVVRTGLLQFHIFI